MLSAPSFDADRARRSWGAVARTPDRRRAGGGVRMTPPHLTRHADAVPRQADPCPPRCAADRGPRRRDAAHLRRQGAGPPSRGARMERTHLRDCRHVRHGLLERLAPSFRESHRLMLRAALLVLLQDGGRIPRAGPARLERDNRGKPEGQRGSAARVRSRARARPSIPASTGARSRGSSRGCPLRGSDAGLATRLSART
jgi:hypothetical protein